jgi:hypothetical protein
VNSINARFGKGYHTGSRHTYRACGRLLYPVFSSPHSQVKVSCQNIPFSQFKPVAYVNSAVVHISSKDILCPESYIQPAHHSISCQHLPIPSNRQKRRNILAPSQLGMTLVTTAAFMRSFCSPRVHGSGQWAARGCCFKIPNHIPCNWYNA